MIALHLPPAPANDVPDREFAIRCMRIIERRGSAMAAWCARLRERGEVGTVEERIDLPRLRALYRALRACLAVVAQ